RAAAAGGPAGGALAGAGVACDADGRERGRTRFRQRRGGGGRLFRLEIHQVRWAPRPAAARLAAAARHHRRLRRAAGIDGGDRLALGARTVGRVLVLRRLAARGPAFQPARAGEAARMNQRDVPRLLYILTAVAAAAWMLARVLT